LSATKDAPVTGLHFYITYGTDQLHHEIT